MEFNFCLYQKLIDSFFFYGTDWCLDLMIMSWSNDKELLSGANIIRWTYIKKKKKKKQQQQQQQISSIFFSFLKKKKKNPLSFWGLNGGELYPLTPKTYWYINIMIKSYYHKQTQ